MRTWVAILVVVLGLDGVAFGQGTFNPYGAAGLGGGVPTDTQPINRKRFNRNNPPLGVTYSINGDSRVEVGDIGRLGNIVVVQVVDDETCLATLGNGDGFSGHQLVMAKMSTAGLVDEKAITVNFIYKVTGTTTYQTARGSQRTVYVVEPFQPYAQKKTTKKTVKKTEPQTTQPEERAEVQTTKTGGKKR